MPMLDNKIATLGKIIPILDNTDSNGTEMYVTNSKGLDVNTFKTIVTDTVKCTIHKQQHRTVSRRLWYQYWCQYWVVDSNWKAQ